MDIIKIDNLEVFANHGVFKAENILGQKFVVSVEMFTDTRKAGKFDDLNFSVDYGKVASVIKSFMEENTFKLIEAAAENLAEKILTEFPLVQKIRLELKKPWAPVKVPVENVSVVIERGWVRAFLALGSNIGDKNKFLDFAVSEIEKSKYCRVEKVSDFIVTKPVGGVVQDDFLNGCVEIKTLFSPFELLEFANGIEKASGRERTIHWGPRTLDIDIIFYDDIVLDEENLKIPHIEMQNRYFVLKPLSQIAPFYKHPVYNLTVREMLEKVGETEK